jgi:coatomer protein complex subunit alpha (xenin)
LYLGDVENRIEMFKELDLYPLAYLTAKAHGMDEEAASLLELSGLTEDQISMPSAASPIATPLASVRTHLANWPVKTSSASTFEKVLLGAEGADEEAAANGYGDEDLIEPDVPADRNGGLDDEDDEGDAEGWDMGEDVEAEVESDFVNVEAVEAGAGSSEADLWARNSPIAADHVAAGSYESAMQLLNRQVGAVNFKPLQWRFAEIYQASRTFLPANAGLPPLVNYVRRTVNETDSRKVLPLIPRDLESVIATEFAAGKTSMRTNKLADGLEAFKKILHLLLLNAVSSAAEVNEVCLNEYEIVMESANTSTGKEAHPYSRAIRPRNDRGTRAPQTHQQQPGRFSL